MMTLPDLLLVLRVLVRDTFRQALALRVFWAMLLVSLLAIVFCLSISTHSLPARPRDAAAERLPSGEAQRVEPFELARSGVDVIEGEVSFLFGAVRIRSERYRDDEVRSLQLLLAGGVADTAGLLLTLLWTAAFLPTFLDPGVVTVLLARPLPRWTLLAGKYLGVLVLVAFQATVFVAGTWLALGVRTGIWAPDYLVCIPLLVVNFAVFFSFSAFLAVWTRSTIVCAFGSLLFWLVCWGMNYGRHAARAVLGEQPGLAALEAGYWVLPKPFDFSHLLASALGAGDLFRQGFHELPPANLLGLSLASSLVFAVVVLAIAGYEFVQADY